MLIYREGAMLCGFLITKPQTAIHHEMRCNALLLVMWCGYTFLQIVSVQFVQFGEHPSLTLWALKYFTFKTIFRELYLRSTVAATGGIKNCKVPVFTPFFYYYSFSKIYLNIDSHTHEKSEMRNEKFHIEKKYI